MIQPPSASHSLYSPVGEISGPPELVLPWVPDAALPWLADAALPWLPDAASWAKDGDSVPMIKTMDTTTPHPDDVARMPNRTASTPQGFGTTLWNVPTTAVKVQELRVDG